MLLWLLLLAALGLASPLRAQVACTPNTTFNPPPLGDCGHQDLPDGALCLYDNYPTGQTSNAAMLFGLCSPPICSSPVTFQPGLAVDVMPPGSFPLHSLELRIESNQFLPDNVVVRLWDSDASVPPDSRCSGFPAPPPDDPTSWPCTVIESWTIPGSLVPSVGTTYGNDCVLTSTLQPLLSQGQRYWVSVSTTDGNTLGGWLRSFLRTSEWVFSNQLGILASWQASIEETPGLCPPPGPPCEQRVGLLAVTVPEPGALAAGAVALLAAAALARRRPRA